MITVALLAACAAGAHSAEYVVDTEGSDANPGTQKKPLRTIQRAADLMQPGDTCTVRPGVYRESVEVCRSGETGNPIRFLAQPGTKTMLLGTEPILSEWVPHENGIYKTPIDIEFPQIFVDDRMMVEARWPNMRFPEQLWDRKTWAKTGKGSRYGKVVDPALAETGIDWTGGFAVLNVAHQFFTWTRAVDKHEAGSNTFTYTKDLEGITHYADKTAPWEGDRYYLAGKLAALDAPGEWFLDTEAKTLYLFPLDAVDLANARVEAKVRNYAFDIQNCDHIEILGFEFFACTFAVDRGNHCLVEDCHLQYPTFARRVWDPAAAEDWVDQTLVRGDRNVVRRCSLAHSPTSGIAMTGAHNVCEDNLIHDISWYGTLRNLPLRMGARTPGDADGGGTVRRNTVHSFGNAGIGVYGQAYVVEYNHVHDGGLCCEDVSLVYTHLPTCAGTVIRYNWVHGCRTYKGWGLGIRGDDQTRNLTVHHNVVWDCGRDGIIVKGDHNRVHHNTVFDIGTPERLGNFVALHVRGEPRKPWRKQWPLLEKQNVHSEIRNNAARTITGDNQGTPFPEGPNVGPNCLDKSLDLVDPGRFDFRPRKDSPLVDAGREIPGITGEFEGEAPDIGAYEFGVQPWRAGVTWMSKSVCGKY